MIIGVPKEVKDHESRVGITPAGAKELTAAGHKVLVETHAGDLSDFTDDAYQTAGAEIAGNAAEDWDNAEMVVKVKEPVEKEYVFFREGLVLFTYLHLAPLPGLTSHLLEKKVTAIAYETIRDKHNTLPLLTPMSEVAGRMSVQVGANYLEKERGGRGLLLGGVPGVLPANVCIIGGGIVGTNAAKIALGMGARVTIVDLSANRLRELDDIFQGRIHTLASNTYNVAHAVGEADLLIGGVLIPGAAAPRATAAAPRVPSRRAPRASPRPPGSPRFLCATEARSSTRRRRARHRSRSPAAPRPSPCAMRAARPPRGPQPAGSPARTAGGGSACAPAGASTRRRRPPRQRR